MDLHLILEDIWTVYDADAALVTFLETLEDQYRGMADQFLPLLERIASDRLGPKLFNSKICHRIDDEEDIWQLRKGKIRVLWFYDKGRIIVCAHAFVKKSRKTPKQEKDKARKVKAAYFNAQAIDQINVIEDIEE